MLLEIGGIETKRRVKFEASSGHAGQEHEQQGLKWCLLEWLPSQEVHAEDLLLAHSVGSRKHVSRFCRVLQGDVAALILPDGKGSRLRRNGWPGRAERLKEVCVGPGSVGDGTAAGEECQSFVAVTCINPVHDQCANRVR